MFNYDKDKYCDLSHEYPNVIQDAKIYVLPHLIQIHAVVEIFLSNRCTVVVESQHHPIRHGRHCGSRIHLGSTYGRIDYNPKFIWNGKEWNVNTFGTFLFAEVEINELMRQNGD